MKNEFEINGKIYQVYTRTLNVASKKVMHGVQVIRKNGTKLYSQGSKTFVGDKVYSRFPELKGLINA